MKVQYWPYNLKFRHPFTISKGTKTHQPTLVVELEYLGFKGYGEAPAITYYNITVEKMIEDLERKKSSLKNLRLPNQRDTGITCIICCLKIHFLFVHWT